MIWQPLLWTVILMITMTGCAVVLYRLLEPLPRVPRRTLILWVGGPWDGWWTPGIAGNPDKVYISDAYSGHTYTARGVSDGESTVLCYVHESELWDRARQAEILEWARRSGRCL